MHNCVCRECIAAILQSGAGTSSSLTCPLCRAKVQTQKLVIGVNEGAAALEEEDTFTATLEQKASMSDSKLKALLEEVSFCALLDAVKSLLLTHPTDCFDLRDYPLVCLVNGCVS